MRRVRIGQHERTHTASCLNQMYIQRISTKRVIMDVEEWTVDWRKIVVSLRLSCAARKSDNWFPVYLYIELNTCIDVKSNPASTKHLYNIFTTSTQGLRRWSKIVCHTNVLCLLGMCCRVAGCIGHGVYTSMITFSREKHTLWAWMFYSCCNI